MQFLTTFTFHRKHQIQNHNKFRLLALETQPSLETRHFSRRKVTCYLIVTARKRSLGQGNIFTPVCHSVHRGGRAWFYSGGHAWFYLGGMRSFIWGGVRGFILGGVRGFIWGDGMVLFRGVCMVLFRGAYVVLFWGACVVLFGGHAWFYSEGACMVLFRGGMHCFFSFFGYN